MLYTLLRAITGVALQWFYRDIEIAGGERIPHAGPLLVAVNHPNSLVDALVAGRVVPRRLLITAKATLWENPFFRHLLPKMGIVPLRRVSDELRRRGQPDAATQADAVQSADTEADSARPDLSRNSESFGAIVDALAHECAVLIFPEGRSHGEPALAPLKTGLARIALQARDTHGVYGLHIVPIGLTFERKWSPRTRIFVQVGEPIAVDGWANANGDAVRALTNEMEARLRATTLNFPSADDAARILGVARIMARVFDTARPLRAPDPPLAEEVAIVRRVDAVEASLRSVAPERVERFLSRLEALRAELAERDIPVNEVSISKDVRSAAWFVVREGVLIASAGPIAWWGRLNHWIPLRLAESIARRQSKSPEDPAMYTLVVGLGLVVSAYVLQTSIMWWLAGPVWALLYLVSLPMAATWDIRFRDRMRSAARRMRTYFQLRRDPALQSRLEGELAWLRAEALALEELGAARSPTTDH